MEVDCIDENDSLPLIEDSEIEISEDFLIGQEIAVIKAEDKDLNTNLKYALDIESEAYLRIDSRNGRLTLAQTIDKEKHPIFEFGVTVSDGVHTSRRTWRVDVADTNDNAPIFDSPSFSFDVPESASKGTVIGRISATDADYSPKFSQLNYRLISEWGADTFSVDPATGVITLIGELDFEASITSLKLLLTGLKNVLLLFRKLNIMFSRLRSRIHPFPQTPLHFQLQLPFI